MYFLNNATRYIGVVMSNNLTIVVIDYFLPLVSCLCPDKPLAAKRYLIWSYTWYFKTVWQGVACTEIDEPFGNWDLWKKNCKIEVCNAS